MDNYNKRRIFAMLVSMKTDTMERLPLKQLPCIVVHMIKMKRVLNELLKLFFL